MQEDYVNCLNPTYNTVVCGFILQVEETAINERNIRPISDTNQRCGQQSRGLEPGSFSTLWLKMMYVFFRLASVSSHYLFLSHVPRIGGFYLKVFVRNRSILIPVTKSALRKHHMFLFSSLHVGQLKGASLNLRQLSELRVLFWTRSRGRYGLNQTFYNLHS